MASFGVPISSNSYESISHKREWDIKSQTDLPPSYFKLKTANSINSMIQPQQQNANQQLSTFNQQNTNATDYSDDPILNQCPDPQQILRNIQYRRLYVARFGSGVDKLMLCRIFSAFGPVEEVDYRLKDTKPYCFIQFKRVTSVYDALCVMDKYKIGQQTLIVHLPSSIKMVHPNINLLTRSLSPEIQEKWQAALLIGYQQLALMTEHDYKMLSSLFSTAQISSSTTTNSSSLSTIPSTTTSSTTMTNVPTITSTNQANLLHPYKLYIGNIAPTVEESHIKFLFEPYNPVRIDFKPSGASKCFCFVDIVDQASMEQAIASLNSSTLHGQVLQVSQAKVNPNNTHIIPQYALIPFEYDLNTLSFEDPLAVYYPNIIPQEPIVYPILRITNLITVEEYNSEKIQDPTQKTLFLEEIKQDLSHYGNICDISLCCQKVVDIKHNYIDSLLLSNKAIARGRNAVPSSPPLHSTAQKASLSTTDKHLLAATPYTATLKEELLNEENLVEKVCLFVKFSSSAESRIAFIRLQNQLFDGHEICVDYSLTMQ